MTYDLAELAMDWLDAKQREEDAVVERRRIEDRIRSLADISDSLDGVETIKPGDYVIKITGRLNRRIDADKLQDIAVEAGLQAYLPNLFRWKPEINLGAWKYADQSITNVLAGAITTEPGRASFKINRSKE